MEGSKDVQIMESLLQIFYQAGYVRVNDLQLQDWHLFRKSLHSVLIILINGQTRQYVQFRINNYLEKSFEMWHLGLH